MFLEKGAYVIRANPNYPNPDWLNPTQQVYDPEYPLDDTDPMVLSQQPNRGRIEALRAYQPMKEAQAASDAAAAIQRTSPSPEADAAVAAALASQVAVVHDVARSIVPGSTQSVALGSLTLPPSRFQSTTTIVSENPPAVKKSWLVWGVVIGGLWLLFRG